jgi:hypothetical protein
MTDIPFVTNAQSAASGRKGDSIFRRPDGQTKEFHRRPRIAAARPQPHSSGATAASR